MEEVLESYPTVVFESHSNVSDETNAILLVLGKTRIFLDISDDSYASAYEAARDFMEVTSPLHGLRRRVLD